MFGRLWCILLTRPNSSVLQVCRVRSLMLRLTRASCLTCSVRFLGLHRAGVPGRSFPSRIQPPGRRRAVSRGSVYSRSKKRVGVGSVVGQAFRSERRAGVGSEAFRSERRDKVGSERRSSLARPSSRRLDRRSGLSLGFWASPGVARRSQRRLSGRAFCWEASP